jgi:hypothetical protein
MSLGWQFMFKESHAITVDTCHLCCFSVFVIGGGNICQDLQENVYEILVCPLHVSRTYLFSINSSSLCAACTQQCYCYCYQLLLAQIVQVTIGVCASKEESCNNHPYPSSEHGNAIYVKDNVGAPLDHKPREKFQSSRHISWSRMYGNHHQGWCTATEVL